MLDGHFIDPADAADNFQEVDFVVVYCPQCHERIEFPVAHPHAAGNYHQAVNIPKSIATSMRWNPQDVRCDICDLTLVVDKVYEESKRVELKVRIDGSKLEKHLLLQIIMNNGHTSWYDDVGGQYYGI